MYYAGRLTALTLSALCSLLAQSAWGQAPRNATALFKSGQVFLSWDEEPQATAYKIYSVRDSAPKLSDLTPANLRVSVPKNFGTNHILADLSKGDGGFGNSGWTRLHPPCIITRNVIVPLDPAASGLAAPIPEGRSLVVLTTHTDGSYYYVVTSMVGGVESRQLTATAGGNVVGPVSETVQGPEPLLIWQSNTKSARMYLQYVDIEKWNSFHHGWPYWVGTRKTPRQDRTGGMELRLMGGDQHMRDADDSLTQYEIETRSIDLKVMPTENWELWFGHSSTQDSVGAGTNPVKTGPIVNYSQARIMDFLEWMIERSTYYGPQIDTNRVTVRGGSNGGFGCLQMAINYPDFFTAGVCDVPPTNIIEGRYSIATYQRFFGDGTTDLPVSFRGWRSGKLNARFEGTPAAKWLNLDRTVLDNPSWDIPYLRVVHGGRDGDVPWPTHGRNLYTNLDASRRGFCGGLDGGGDHSNANMPQVDQLLTLRRNHAFPAINNAGLSAALPLPVAPEARKDPLHSHFLWSTPTYKVGGIQAMVDQLNRFEMVLASTLGNDVADVTPRRLQAFDVTAGKKYYLKNVSVNDEKVVYQSDSADADANGLITFKKFQIKSGTQTAGGSRLVIFPAVPAVIGTRRPPEKVKSRTPSRMRKSSRVILPSGSHPRALGFDALGIQIPAVPQS